MNDSNLNKEQNEVVENKATEQTPTTSEEVKETATTAEEKVEETKEEEAKTETPSATTPATTATTTAVTAEKPLELKYLDRQFINDVLGTPTYSRAEYRMVTFIILWARQNNVTYEFDDYGNIYLTKGELAEGECYPCVTSHLDTVQREQETYAQCGISLPIEERINAKGLHELYVKGTGIGADDKAGVLISLSLFKYFDKLKACFFLEEEIGCNGSKALNKAWFDNVGYVIGWDSPERNRAAYACSGELLFSKDFFQKIEETCKTHGVTDFRSEPFTDVKEIRMKTEVMCMNFGNGGWLAHSPSEYVVIEEMDGACGLGVALIKLLGTEKYRMKSKAVSYNATYATDEDVKFFAQRSGYHYGGYGTYGDYHGSTYNNYSTSGATRTTTTSTAATDKVEQHVLDYMAKRYEEFIEGIQKKVESREALILDEIKKLCEKNGTDYSEFLKIFTDNPSSEPFSTAIEF